jgi:hypothetical protein
LSASSASNGPALAGSDGEWPFAGHFRGAVGDRSLAWAGRVAPSAGPEVAFRVSRRVSAALAAVPIGGDRRRVLSDAWLALDAIPASAFGPSLGGDLVLLLVSRDEDGAAVAGVGVDAVWAGGDGGAVVPWILAPHPLLGPPGRTGAKRGALAIDTLPPWILARAADGPDLGAMSVQRALRVCGVRR